MVFFSLARLNRIKVLGRRVSFEGHEKFNGFPSALKHALLKDESNFTLSMDSLTMWNNYLSDVVSLSNDLTVNDITPLWRILPLVPINQSQQYFSLIEQATIEILQGKSDADIEDTEELEREIELSFMMSRVYVTRNVEFSLNLFENLMSILLMRIFRSMYFRSTPANLTSLLLNQQSLSSWASLLSSPSLSRDTGREGEDKRGEESEREERREREMRRIKEMKKLTEENFMKELKVHQKLKGDSLDGNSGSSFGLFNFLMSRGVLPNSTNENLMRHILRLQTRLIHKNLTELNFLLYILMRLQWMSSLLSHGWEILMELSRADFPELHQKIQNDFAFIRISAAESSANTANDPIVVTIRKNKNLMQFAENVRETVAQDLVQDMRRAWAKTLNTHVARLSVNQNSNLPGEEKRGERGVGEEKRGEEKRGEIGSAEYWRALIKGQMEQVKKVTTLHTLCHAQDFSPCSLSSPSLSPPYAYNDLSHFQDTFLSLLSEKVLEAAFTPFLASSHTSSLSTSSSTSSSPVVSSPPPSSPAPKKKKLSSSDLRFQFIGRTLIPPQSHPLYISSLDLTVPSSST